MKVAPDILASKVEQAITNKIEKVSPSNVTTDIIKLIQEENLYFLISYVIQTEERKYFAGMADTWIRSHN